MHECRFTRVCLQSKVVDHTQFCLGCMIVEILDYRPQKASDPALEIPERTRTVLHPNGESLYADICLLNSTHGVKWTDADALEVEARILVCFPNTQTS